MVPDYPGINVYDGNISNFKTTMSKVITFSRFFPKGHPREGQRTHFVEKIWKIPGIELNEIPSALNAESLFFVNLGENIKPKYHTIRAGHRFKEGEYFSPRVWSDKPYDSKQIAFAKDIEIKKIFDFKMDENGVISVDGKYINPDLWVIVAINDGLSEGDFFHWFMPNINKPKAFDGQIICWNEEITYDIDLWYHCPKCNIQILRSQPPFDEHCYCEEPNWKLSKIQIAYKNGMNSFVHPEGEDWP